VKYRQTPRPGLSALHQPALRFDTDLLARFLPSV
jgi:hypothetical protein